MGSTVVAAVDQQPRLRRCRSGVSCVFWGEGRLATCIALVTRRSSTPLATTSARMHAVTSPGRARPPARSACPCTAALPEARSSAGWAARPTCSPATHCASYTLCSSRSASAVPRVWPTAHEPRRSAGHSVVGSRSHSSGHACSNETSGSSVPRPAVYGICVRTRMPRQQ